MICYLMIPFNSKEDADLAAQQIERALNYSSEPIICHQRNVDTFLSSHNSGNVVREGKKYEPYPPNSRDSLPPLYEEEEDDMDTRPES